MPEIAHASAPDSPASGPERRLTSKTKHIEGRISQTSVADFTGHATTGGVLVRTPEPVRLGQVLAAPGITMTNDGTDRLRVSGITAEQIGTAAWHAHLPVYELTPTHASLEEAFMQVTKDSVEYHAGATR